MGSYLATPPETSSPTDRLTQLENRLAALEAARAFSARPDGYRTGAPYAPSPPGPQRPPNPQRRIVFAELAQRLEVRRKAIDGDGDDDGDDGDDGNDGD